jgi:transcriptional regulator with XRE-family HTH domain
MAKNTIKFKNRIKEYRENQGITMMELAEAIGKSLSTVRNMEKNKNFPRGDTREKIMKFLNASFVELFFEE